MLLGWYVVAKLNNVKPTLRQHCVCKRLNLQRWTTLSISTLILTTLDNVVTALQIRPFAKNWKEQKYVWAFEEKQWNWICWTLSLDCYFKIFLTLLPTLREIQRRIFAKPRKILMISWKCCITRTVFKPFHYVKYWLAFN